MCAVDHRRRGMASRAQVGAPRLRQQLGGACAKEVGIGGAEAHHRDVGAEPHHVQPLVAIDVGLVRRRVQHVRSARRERGEHARCDRDPHAVARVDAHRGVPLGRGDGLLRRLRPGLLDRLRDRRLGRGVGGRRPLGQLEQVVGPVDADGSGDAAHRQASQVGARRQLAGDVRQRGALQLPALGGLRCDLGERSPEGDLRRRLLRRGLARERGRRQADRVEHRRGGAGSTPAGRPRWSRRRPGPPGVRWPWRRTAPAGRRTTPAGCRAPLPRSGASP